MSFSKVSLKEALQNMFHTQQSRLEILADVTFLSPCRFPTVMKNQLDPFEGQLEVLRSLVYVCASPGSDMDVLQQAGKTICQRDAEWCKQVVPIWLHVLAGPALGIALAARVLVVWGYDVGDEVVVTTGGLRGWKQMCLSQTNRG